MPIYVLFFYLYLHVLTWGQDSEGQVCESQDSQSTDFGARNVFTWDQDSVGQDSGSILTFATYSLGVRTLGFKTLGVKPLRQLVLELEPYSLGVKTLG